VPGSLVIRRAGTLLQTPLMRLAPDPLTVSGEGTPAAVRRSQWRQNC